MCLSGRDPVSGGFPDISIYFHFYVYFVVFVAGCAVCCMPVAGFNSYCFSAIKLN